MRASTFFLLLVLVSVQVISQTLPTSRTVDWNSAGLSNISPEPTTVVDFVENGGKADGIHFNDAVMAQVLQSLPEAGAVIYFPEGTYLFQETITLSSNTILRGASAETTRFIFSLNETADLISLRGSSTSIASNVLSDASKGDMILEIADPDLLAVGDYLKISENDEALVTSPWAQNSTGEIAQITAIEGNLIMVNTPLRRNFTVDNQAQVVKLNMITQSGIEQIGIERTDETEWQSNNIHLEYSANCWVTCVESTNCNFAHVDIRNSTNNLISGSYFHHAFDYGGGGKAYGVVLQNATGLCLVENNIFNHLRHAMLLQAGANGNVIGYNFSTDPYWTGVMLPTNAAGDIVLHGNYPYANLFEGNTIQNVVIDNSHGINGPDNTFFRNRVELYGIVMNSDAGNQQNFIGNEITNTSFLMGNYLLSGTDHFEYGNLLIGSLKPSGTAEPSEASLYKTEIPDYYLTHSVWPPIGNFQHFDAHIIEAEDRFHSGSFTACNEAATVSARAVEYNDLVSVYPNPASDFIRISTTTSNPVRSIEIIAKHGQLVWYATGKKHIDISHFSKGIYFLKIRLADEKTVVKQLVKL